MSWLSELVRAARNVRVTIKPRDIDLAVGALTGTASPADIVDKVLREACPEMTTSERMQASALALSVRDFVEQYQRRQAQEHGR